MATEAGIRALRAFFIRETVPNVTPTNPEWLRFSDELDSVSYSPQSNNFERRAIGSPDPVGFSLGPEDHKIGLVYSMQRWLAAAGPVPLDAAADGMLRDVNGGYLSTHSVLLRQDFLTGGTDGAGFRLYTYGTGGYISRVMISGSPNSGDPSKSDVTYTCQKVRSYLLNQPAVTGGFTVVSSSALDTTQSVVIENFDASITETIALNGTTPVVGVTATFTNIDSVRLDGECQGDVTVTFTTGGLVCTVIEGVLTNNGIEGDLGLPSLGASGSYEAPLGLPFQTVLSASVARGGSPLAANVMGISFEVLNNLEMNAVVGTRIKTVAPGDRNLNFKGTVFSDKASHDDIIAHMKANAADMVWTFTGGATARTVTIGSAVLQTPGDRAYNKGQATMRRDNTFIGQSIVISTGL